VNREHRALSIVNSLYDIAFTSEFAISDKNLSLSNIYFLNSLKNQTICGFTDKELTEKNLFFRNVHPDDRLELIENIFVLGAGESLKYEFRFKEKEGNYTWLRLNMTVFSKDENFIEAGGVIESITKEKNLETILYTIKEINRLAVKTYSEEELLRNLCDLLVDKLGYVGVFVGDIDSQKLFRLKYFAKNTPEELVISFKNVTISVDETIPEGQGTVGNAYRTGKIFLISDTINSPKMRAWVIYHEKYGIRSTCSIPLSKAGRVEFVLIIYSKTPGLFSEEYMDILNEIEIDISFALEKIEKEKNMKLLSDAMDESSEWFLVADERGTILHANKAVERFSGYNLDEIIGKNILEFNSGDLSEHNKGLFDKVLSGEKCQCEISKYAKDKSIFYLNNIIVPIFFDNKLYRLIQLSRDITKEKLQQERISELTRLYMTLSDINQLIVRTDSFIALYAKMNEILVKDAGFSIVYFSVIDEENKLKLYNYYYLEDDKKDNYVEFLKFIEESYKFKEIPLLVREGFVDAIAIETKEISCYNDISISMKNDEIKDKFKDYEFLRSGAAIPIFKNNKVLGSIFCGSSKKDFFTSDVLRLLNEIGSDISFALGKIELERFNAMTSLALNSGSDFVMVTDKNFKIVYINDNAQKIFGYSRVELINHHHSIISSRSQGLGFARRFYKTIRSGQKFSDFFVYRTKSNEKIYCYTTITPYLIRGEIRYYVAVGKDITHTKSLEDSLKKLKDYDPLTGLINRNKFIESANEFIKIAKYEKKLESVCIINPMNFSAINQAYGFYTGDLILCDIAKRIQDSLRDYDLIAKLESDMFIILLKDIASLEDVINIISKLNFVLEKPYNTPKEKEVLVSFNYGVSFFPNDGDNAQILFERANIALGSIKNSKNRKIGFYKKDFEQRARIKLDLKSKLEKAISNKEFFLYYQPIFSVKDKSIIGAEALLRWKDNGNIILPMEFIPMLEDMDRLIEVEKLVVDSVFSKLRQWEEKGKSSVPISINLSERSFKDENFRQHIIYSVKKYAIRRKLFSIELLERMFVEDFECCLAILKKFKREGISISLDDFGTGYSSLNYLYKLQFDYIKIDKSFINNIANDIRAKSIIESIIFLSKKLDLITVAEGVETLEQLTMLENLGCDYIQGYLLARPMPEEDFEDLL
jgi:diguanylate cyclase (GGDEF)-like protein/PAS domain S-box-containing protein